MIIKDAVYGDFDVNEDIIVELINSEPLKRLKNISQQGYPNGTQTEFPIFSRYEHSVGVMLILRKLNASTEEQVAGLLHDVSHTAFSHIIDWVVGDRKNEGYQDAHLSEVINLPPISTILSKHGYSIEKIAGMEYNNAFGLLERKIPDLCADRLDYSIREVSYWFDPSLKDCINHLIIHDGEIIFDGEHYAEIFARDYMRCQIEHWGSAEAKLRYHFISMALRLALEKGTIQNSDLATDDVQVIKKLKESNDESIIFNLNKGLGKLNFVESEDGDIHLSKKFRYVDPKFMDNGEIKRISDIDKEYLEIIEKERARSNSIINVKVM